MVALALAACVGRAGPSTAAEPIAPAVPLGTAAEAGSLDPLGPGDAPESGGSPFADIDAAEAQGEAAPRSAGPTRGLSSKSREKIEEIVVSARKRAELLEETPVSVTAIGVDELRASGSERLNQIRQLVPNMQFESNASGVNTASSIRLRGIGTTRPSTAFDPAVAVYLDGVYLGRGLNSVMSVVDVQQIEVLRGPQGTLFGKNSVGGAVNVTTAKPSPDLEGEAFVRAGNFGTVETRSMLNLPIASEALGDTLAVRLAASTVNFGGYSENTLLDVPANDLDAVSFIGTVRWQPLEALTVDVTGRWGREHGHNQGGQCRVVNPTAPLAPAGFLDACRASTDPYRFESNVLQIVDQASSGAWGVLALDVGEVGPLDDVVAKSITSWGQGATRLRTDLDYTAYPVGKIGSIGDGVQDGGPVEGWAMQQEGQLNASAWEERIQFVSGVFAYWEQNRAPTTLTLGTALPPLNGSTLTIAETDNSDWALYSQGTLTPLEWLGLTGGVRFTQEKRHTDYTSIALPAERPCASCPFAGTQIFNEWTPMASLQLTAPEDLLVGAPDALGIQHLMGYFTWSQGFRGGGFNSTVSPVSTGLGPFKPETIESYEIGTKAILFEQRLSFGLSAFLYDYSDLQVTMIRTGDDGRPVQMTENAAAATGKGIEFEAQGMLLPGLVGQGSVGVLNTRYDDFATAVNDITGKAIDRAGESFLDSPELQTHLALMWSLPVDGGTWATDGFITPRIDWYYQAAAHFLGPEVEAAQQPGYNLLHARLSWLFLEDRAEVAIWAQNLLNIAYRTGATGFGPTLGYASTFWGMPRTFGGEVSYRF